jgi:hypothetical protein
MQKVLCIDHKKPMQKAIAPRNNASAESTDKLMRKQAIASILDLLHQLWPDAIGSKLSSGGKTHDERKLRV